MIGQLSLFPRFGEKLKDNIEILLCNPAEANDICKKYMSESQNLVMLRDITLL